MSNVTTSAAYSYLAYDMCEDEADLHGIAFEVVGDDAVIVTDDYGAYTDTEKNSRRLTRAEAREIWRDALAQFTWSSYHWDANGKSRPAPTATKVPVFRVAVKAGVRVPYGA